MSLNSIEQKIFRREDVLKVNYNKAALLISKTNAGSREYQFLKINNRFTKSNVGKVPRTCFLVVLKKKILILGVTIFCPILTDVKTKDLKQTLISSQNEHFCHFYFRLCRTLCSQLRCDNYLLSLI